LSYPARIDPTAKRLVLDRDAWDRMPREHKERILRRSLRSARVVRGIFPFYLAKDKNFPVPNEMPDVKTNDEVCD